MGEVHPADQSGLLCCAGKHHTCVFNTLLSEQYPNVLTADTVLSYRQTDPLTS